MYAFQGAVKNKSVTFSGSFNGTDLEIGEHGFYTGDAVYYTPVSETNTLGIKEGTYYVKRVNSKVIKLSNSRSNLYNQIYHQLSLHKLRIDQVLIYLFYHLSELHK